MTPFDDHSYESRRSPWGDTIWFASEDHSLDPRFRECGICWEHELEALKDVVARGSVVLDVGASIGYLSCYLAELAGPCGEVHAFEPAPNNLSLLRRNMAWNRRSNVHVIDAAVGAEPGSAQLWLSRTKFGRQSLCERNVPDAGSKQVVRVVTVDGHWAENLRRRTIDVLKIDAEGSELAVLRGARRALRNTRHVWTEFWPAGLKNFGEDAYQIVRILLDAGFRLTQWDLATGESGPVADEGPVRRKIEEMTQEYRPGGPYLPITYLHGARE